jgi:hypothetical protein
VRPWSGAATALGLDCAERERAVSNRGRATLAGLFSRSAAESIMRSTADHLIVQTDPDAVARFTDHLAAFNQDDWFAVAAVAADDDMPSRSTAYAVVEALIAHYGLGVEAWFALDDVQTVAHCSLDDPGSLARSRHAATWLRMARNAANAAALALLVRPLLSAAEFDALYRPFAACIPA